jgi:hypothetical protein
MTQPAKPCFAGADELAAMASPATMTGQIVHHDEFGRTWPDDSSVACEQQ